MVKLLSILLALSTITPIFASVFRDLETRDLSEPYLFGRELSDAEAAVYARDIQELFARQHDSENVARHKPKSDDDSSKHDMPSQADNAQTKRVPQEEIPHPPPTKHELPPPEETTVDFDDLVDSDFDDEHFEPDHDHELYFSDHTDEDLFEQFYDDADY